MTAQNEEKMMEAFDVVDAVIEQAYPNIYGLEKGMWGHQRIQNYGILRGAIASAIAQERIESQKREAALQEQLHAQRMVAIDNKDWFDALKVDYDKLQIELSKYKEAKPVGIVRMSNPPDGNPKPIPKWILSEDQSHLKDGDLLYARPDNARE